MPFTLAHPAAVLPLRRVRLLHTVPLIIGAMTPDAPYYLPWVIAKHIPEVTHTLVGTFTLDLPIGIFLLLFMWLLRRQLAAPLAAGARVKCLAALERFGSRRRNWVLAPLSLLAGSWTHLAWDSFTHSDGWLVSRISALSAPVTLFSYTGELCHVLQYASSVFGLVVLAVWFHLSPTPAERLPDGGRSAGGPLLLAGLLAGAVVAGAVETAAHVIRHMAMPATYHLFYLLLTRIMAWFALLYTAAGIVMTRSRRRAATASVI